MAKSPILTVIAPGSPVLEAAVDHSPFVLGRDPTCDLALEFQWLSRRHLVFEQSGEAWTVRSEGRNEVRVDGEILADSRAVVAGTTIVMGPLTLHFDSARATASPLSDESIGAVTMALSVSDIFGPARANEPARHLARLGELSGRLAGVESRDGAAKAACSELLRTLDARAACIVVIEKSGQIVVLGDKARNVSRRLVERALADQATLCLEDAAHSEGVGPSTSIIEGRVGPVIVAPLGSPTVGVVYADRGLGDPAFSTDDASFCTVLAHLVGSALDAARRSEQILESRDRLAEERRELARDIERRGHFGHLIGSSAPMRRLAESIAKVSPTDATVLINGETGSGKELVAREVHQRSQRSEGPFFALNCAALPENLIESELFGHKRGAFTGADKDRRGIFELAAGGTVFLDEIGELPLAAQAKVLRVLDAREVLPLGSTGPVRINVRLVAATHRDLEAEVVAGRFRQDLLFRLKVFPILLPPLRDRLDDVPVLATHFLAQSASARQKGVVGATSAAIDALQRYSYPGNVRELAHIIERAVILSDDGGSVDVEHLPDDLATLPSSTPVPEGAPPNSLRSAVADFERRIIVKELERYGWNRTRTARALKVSLRAFMDKLKRYDVKEPSAR